MVRSLMSGPWSGTSVFKATHSNIAAMVNMCSMRTSCSRPAAMIERLLGSSKGHHQVARMSPSTAYGSAPAVIPVTIAVDRAPETQKSCTVDHVDSVKMFDSKSGSSSECVRSQTRTHVPVDWFANMKAAVVNITPKHSNPVRVGPQTAARLVCIHIMLRAISDVKSCGRTGKGVSKRG